MFATVNVWLASDRVFRASSRAVATCWSLALGRDAHSIGQPGTPQPGTAVRLTPRCSRYAPLGSSRLDAVWADHAIELADRLQDVSPVRGIRALMSYQRGAWSRRKLTHRHREEASANCNSLARSASLGHSTGPSPGPRPGSSGGIRRLYPAWLLQGRLCVYETVLASAPSGCARRCPPKTAGSKLRRLGSGVLPLVHSREARRMEVLGGLDLGSACHRCTSRARRWWKTFT